MPIVMGAFAASDMAICPEAMECTRLNVSLPHEVRVGAEVGAIPAANVWTPREDS